MPGKTVEELSEGVPNGQVGVTTVGAIRNPDNGGGNVIPRPTRSNPNHAVVEGLTADQASALFKPTIPNPSRQRRRGDGHA